jgi:hypothetical protein
MNESQIISSILEYLKLNNIFAIRNNSGGFKLKNGGYVRNGVKGSPDIIANLHGIFFAIEVKTPERYNNVSEAQKECINKINEDGGFAIVVCDIEDISFMLDTYNSYIDNNNKSEIIKWYERYFIYKYIDKIPNYEILSIMML